MHFKNTINRKRRRLATTIGYKTNRIASYTPQILNCWRSFILSRDLFSQTPSLGQKTLIYHKFEISSNFQHLGLV